MCTEIATHILCATRAKKVSKTDFNQTDLTFEEGYKNNPQFAECTKPLHQWIFLPLSHFKYSRCIAKIIKKCLVWFWHFFTAKSIYINHINRIPIYISNSKLVYFINLSNMIIRNINSLPRVTYYKLHRK